MFFYHQAQKYPERTNDNSNYSICGLKNAQCFVDRASFNEPSLYSRIDESKISYLKFSAPSVSVDSGMQPMVAQPEILKSQAYDRCDNEVLSKTMQRVDQDVIKRSSLSNPSIVNSNDPAGKSGGFYVSSSVPSTPTLAQFSYQTKNILDGEVADGQIDRSRNARQGNCDSSRLADNEAQQSLFGVWKEKKDDLKNDQDVQYQSVKGSANVNNLIPHGRLEHSSRYAATPFSAMKSPSAFVSKANRRSAVGTTTSCTPNVQTAAGVSLDYNDDNAAARMLRFLQVHSPSQKSIAELFTDCKSIIEDEFKGGDLPTFVFAESRSTSVLAVAKEKNEGAAVTECSKTSQEQPISAKYVKKDTEYGKTLESDPKIEGILPDLRHVLPPWHKLVGNSNRVVQLEDRDELFVPDDEKQDIDGSNPTVSYDADRQDAIRMRSRATIDPSFDALFVAMAQMVPCRLNVDDQNSAITSYKNHEIGFPGLACRHCGGRPGSGRYFPNSVRSLSQTTTAHNMIKHFASASIVVPDDETNDKDVGVCEGRDTEERENNDADDKNGWQKKIGKAQRIGGRHCTKCPYSVWLWLNEFQRRLKDYKSPDGSGDVDNIPQESGQRVKYGARKIFYNRVWQRMNTQNDLLPNDEERDDIDNKEEINIINAQNLSCGPFGDDFVTLPKKKKESLKGKKGNPKGMLDEENFTTKTSEISANHRRPKKRKSEIQFLDLTSASNANSGDLSEHKQKQHRY